MIAEGIGKWNLEVDRNDDENYGRCSSARRTIVLTPITLERQPHMLRKVVCHEIVHAHGYSHGPEFDQRLDEMLARSKKRRRQPCP